MSPRTDIKSLDPGALATALTGLGQPRYRTDQILRWLYVRRVSSFDAMTDLPRDLRDVLASAFDLSLPEVIDSQTSADGTRKYLVRLGDGASVETVAMPSGERLTVCYSTQVGCAMGCTFCATGRSGFVRDLTCGEIVDQVTLVGDDLGTRVSNAVAMGQGEPFANYDAVLAGLRMLNAPDLCGIGARHLTVSTCGLVGGIRRFAAEPEQFTLAVSLHSAVQSTRDKLMPGVKGQPLPALRTALRDYVATGRRPTLEYALINGRNDTAAELDALVRFCTGLGVHVNLIPINPVAGASAKRPEPEAVRRLVAALGRAGVEASVRVERGADIDAACGQLRQRSL